MAKIRKENMEKWKPIKNFEGLYEVSDKGNVRSLDRTVLKSDGRKQRFKGKTLVPAKNNGGYLHVDLRNCGKRKIARVNRLVADAFIDNKYNKPQVNHIDGDKTNNHVNNLEWCTSSENVKHAVKTGLFDKQMVSIEVLGKVYKSKNEACRTLGKSITYINKHGIVTNNLNQKK